MSEDFSCCVCPSTGVLNVCKVGTLLFVLQDKERRHTLCSFAW